MKDLSDAGAIDRILKAIAQDDSLIEQFAKAVGVEESEFGDWIDSVKVPVAELPKKVFVSVRFGEDDELNPCSIFYAVHTTQEQAEGQVDKLTSDFGPLGFGIVEAPLNP